MDFVSGLPFQQSPSAGGLSAALELQLAELGEDNQQLTQSLRTAHELCDKHNDVATASLIETWIDETERRAWFLSEIQTGARC